MLTFDQQMNAWRIIAQRKGENPDMRISWECHKMAVRDCWKYYFIPYKVYFDYLRNRAYNPSNKLMLNPCFPNPGIPVEAALKVTEDDFNIKEGAKREEVFTFENLKEGVKEQAEAIIKRHRPWKFFDDDWLKTFRKHLNGYKTQSFTFFDYFGGRPGEIPFDGHMADESDYEQLKDLYWWWERHEDYSYEPPVPMDYDYEDPEYKPEYAFDYLDKPFILMVSEDEAKQEIKKYNHMGLLLSEQEQAAYLKRYGYKL